MLTHNKKSWRRLLAALLAFMKTPIGPQMDDIVKPGAKVCSSLLLKFRGLLRARSGHSPQCTWISRGFLGLNVRFADIADLGSLRNHPACAIG